MSRVASDGKTNKKRPKPLQKLTDAVLGTELRHDYKIAVGQMVGPDKFTISHAMFDMAFLERERERTAGSTVRWVHEQWPRWQCSVTAGWCTCYLPVVSPNATGLHRLALPEEHQHDKRQGRAGERAAHHGTARKAVRAGIRTC